MNLKPFNLEKALAGAKVVTRNGQEVTEIYECKTTAKGQQNIVSVVDGEAILHNKQGRFFTRDSESVLDLFMLPEVKTYWLNIYRGKDECNLMVTSCICLAETEAKFMAEKMDYTFTLIKTISFDVEV